MTRPNVTIANCKTGKIVTREMNDDEYAQYLLDLEADAAE
jgi:hypothetical protein